MIQLFLDTTLPIGYRFRFVCNGYFTFANYDFRHDIFSNDYQSNCTINPTSQSIQPGFVTYD